MSTVDVKLQNVLLPVEGFPAHLFVRDALDLASGEERCVESDEDRWDFAVSKGEIVRDGRRPRPSADDRDFPCPYALEDGSLVIPAGGKASFSCYFNMASAAKWLDLTYVRNILLSLTLQGEAEVDVWGYRMDDIESHAQVRRIINRQHDNRPERRLSSLLLASASAGSDGPADLVVRIGHPDVTLLGFTVEARGEVRVFGGAWLGSVDEEHVRPVDLRVITTTFRKEEFITRNIATFKELIAGDEEVSRHLGVTVVDNGRTLDADALSGGGVEVVGNDNVGGAGGFARGMMEAIGKDPAPTHVVVMDDDVVALPESFVRTYSLLRVLEPQYHDSFIAGAMLRLEDKDVQHEDIGFMHREGFYAPKKPAHRLSAIADCALNEVGWLRESHEYAAWWYCCIPMKFVNEESLPIPFFVRGDDVEFSLRSDAPVLSLNGIGVWHLGFGGKFSAQMEYHQVIRNSFILCALHPECADVDVIGRCDELFGALVCEFAYDYADLVLDALEDFLSGPSVIEKPNGLDVIREKGKRNEKLLPLGEVFDGNMDFAEVFGGAGSLRPDKFAERRIARRSLNGQASMQDRVGEGMGVAPADWEYRFEPVLFKKSILVVDPTECTATMRERDSRRFAEVMERKERLFERYAQTRGQVEAAYREAFPRLTSYGFWEEYLGLK